MYLVLLIVASLCFFYETVCLLFLFPSTLDVQVTIPIRRQHYSLDRVIDAMVDQNSPIRSMNTKEYREWITMNSGIRVEEKSDRYIWDNPNSIYDLLFQHRV